MNTIPTVHVQIACMAPWLSLSRGERLEGGKRWARTATTLRRSEQRPPEIDPCSAPDTTFRGTKHRPQQTRMVNTPWHAHARWRRTETSARMITVPAGAMGTENKHLRRREIAPSNVQTRPPSTVARVGCAPHTRPAVCRDGRSPARAGRRREPRGRPAGPLCKFVRSRPHNDGTASAPTQQRLSLCADGARAPFGRARRGHCLPRDPQPISDDERKRHAWVIKPCHFRAKGGGCADLGQIRRAAIHRASTEHHNLLRRVGAVRRRCRPAVPCAMPRLAPPCGRRWRTERWTMKKHGAALRRS